LVGSIYPACRRRDDEFFFKYVSFLAPGTIYRYAFAEERLSVFRQIDVKGFDAEAFRTEQIFYEGKDGTRIPMFLVHNRTLQRNGDNPVLLYGYGGFNISLLPSFSVFQLVWIQHYGGVLAIPNIRGGGEYGEEWHQAGILARKQTGFDDFIAAAEKLVAEGITRPERICIQGGSNGGLLVGACVTQRPDLFGAGIAQVGVLDMLRFHKFTIGHAWTADYGNPDKDQDAEILLKYSPLHNVRAEKPYPALLLTTGDHDDRVSPLHSYKFIAEVQHKLGTDPRQSKPLLIRIETKAGHGAGIPTAKLLEEAADRYAFAATSVGAHWKD
jgi:prolyl oligopeptidase